MVICEPKYETSTDLAEAVRKQLGIGEHEALPWDNIASRLGIRGTRRLRLSQIDLLEQGIPVVYSTHKGVYIAGNHEEASTCLESLTSYIRQLARHRKLLKRAIQHHFNTVQMRML